MDLSTVTYAAERRHRARRPRTALTSSTPSAPLLEDLDRVCAAVESDAAVRAVP